MFLSKITWHWADSAWSAGSYTFASLWATTQFAFSAKYALESVSWISFLISSLLTLMLMSFLSGFKRGLKKRFWFMSGLVGIGFSTLGCVVGAFFWTMATAAPSFFSAKTTVGVTIFRTFAFFIGSAVMGFGGGIGYVMAKLPLILIGGCLFGFLNGFFVLVTEWTKSRKNQEYQF